MTITIIPDFVPEDHPIRPAPGMKPKYIVVHNTGNPRPGANAEMHGKYLRSQEAIDEEVLWHFTVDDKEIRQHVPLDVNGWHASDGYGPGNMESIGIEICEHRGIDQAKADANAAMLIAHLIKTVPSLLPFPECVKQHYDFAPDKKNCPRIIRGRPQGWEKFLLLIMDRLGPKEKEIRLLFDGKEHPTRYRNANGVTEGPIRPFLDMVAKVGYAWHYDHVKGELRIDSPKARESEETRIQ